MKKIIVLGAGGFIGGHLTRKLKKLGCWVRAVDIKKHQFRDSIADEFIIGDLRDIDFVLSIFDFPFDEVYQLAADMGGAGFVFSGKHDANIIHNSALINLNVANASCKANVKKIFYSSSACIYPEHNQLNPDNPNCSESSAYPANPDSEYGWEKLFSERLYLSFHRNHNLNVRIGRFHNIFGPFGSWNDGREKAPAAICRKIAEAEHNGKIEIWGDGKQTRSFLYVDECIEAILRLMKSNFIGPLNIGSEEMVTINELTSMIMNIANKKLTIKHINGPQGVRGRNSDNSLIEEKLKWKPNSELKDGLIKTYNWIEKQTHNSKNITA